MVEIKKELDVWNKEDKIMFKFTIPTVANLYLDLYDYEAVVRIVALSGGFSQKEACLKLKHVKGVIASFSRALAENLAYNQTTDEFNKTIATSIDKIYDASINKE